MDDRTDKMGDDQLEHLIEENMPRLRAFIRMRTSAAIRARESHSDLVQSVCRELVQGAERFDFQGEEAFRKWLFTAALRKIVERDRRMRAQKRDVDREVSPAAGGQGGRRDGELLDAYHTLSTPSLILSRKEQLAAIEGAFDELTEEHREIISLARVGGMSHKEIAEATGKSEEACRQLLRRALIKLELALERRGVHGG